MRSRPAGGAWVLDGAGKAYTIRNGSCGDSVTAGRRCATRFARRCARGSLARRWRGERPYAVDGLTARNRHSRMHVHARSVSFPVMPIASAARVLHATTPRRVDQHRERHVTTDDCKGIRDHDLRGWHGAGPGWMCDQSGRGGIGDDGGHAGTATELSGQLPRDKQSLHGVRAQQQRPHRQGLGARRVP